MEFLPKQFNFLQNGYSEKRAPSVIRTTMTNGTVRQRLLNVGAPHTLNVSLMLHSQKEYQDFMKFYELINYGSDWFVAPILNDRSDSVKRIIARKVRIQNGAFTEKLNFASDNVVRTLTLVLDVDNVEYDEAWSEYYE